MESIQVNKVSESLLIEIRKEARNQKDWKTSDLIRNELDRRNTFVFDTNQGQVVYHELKGMTRQKLINKLNESERAEKHFDAWLYSMNQSKNKTNGRDR